MFSDMQQHWAKDCVARLASLNQLHGYADNTFRPEAKLTRAEFAVLMLDSFPDVHFLNVRSHHLLGESPVNTPLPIANFKDLSPRHWAYQALQSACQKGIYAGYPDNTIRPDQPITREEALFTLSKLMSSRYHGERFYPTPEAPDEVLRDSFTDVTDDRGVAGWSKLALAAATAGFLVVDYPHGQRLRPAQAMTRAEMAASLCQAQQLDGLAPVEAVAGNQHFDWSPQLKKLQRAKTDGHWGWFDRQRQIAVIVKSSGEMSDQTITGLGELIENRAWVSVNGADERSRFGYVDEKGEVAIAPQFATATDFSEGLAAVSDGLNYSFIDALGIPVISAAPFEIVQSFSEGLAAVYQAGQWGFIDRTGALAVPLQPYSVEPFKEGLARIRVFDAARRRYRYGFIDRTGQQIIPPDLAAANSFSEGLAWAVLEDGEGQIVQQGYLNRSGQWALFLPAPEDMGGSSFSEGLASLSTLLSEDRSHPIAEREFRFIDRNGDYVVLLPSRYDSPSRRTDGGNTVQSVGQFVEGVAIAKVGNYSGFINRQGKFVIPPIYSDVQEAKEGYAYVNYGGTQVLLLEGNDGQGSPVPTYSLGGGRWGYIKIPQQP